MKYMVLGIKDKRSWFAACENGRNNLLLCKNCRGMFVEDYPARPNYVRPVYEEDKGYYARLTGQRSADVIATKEYLHLIKVPDDAE